MTTEPADDHAWILTIPITPKGRAGRPAKIAGAVELIRTVVYAVIIAVGIRTLPMSRLAFRRDQ